MDGRGRPAVQCSNDHVRRKSKKEKVSENGLPVPLISTIAGTGRAARRRLAGQDVRACVRVRECVRACVGGNASIWCSKSTRAFVLLVIFLS